MVEAASSSLQSSAVRVPSQSSVVGDGHRKLVRVIAVVCGQHAVAVSSSAMATANSSASSQSSAVSTPSQSPSIVTLPRAASESSQSPRCTG